MGAGRPRGLLGGPSANCGLRNGPERVRGKECLLGLPGSQGELRVPGDVSVAQQSQQVIRKVLARPASSVPRRRRGAGRVGWGPDGGVARPGPRRPGGAFPARRALLLYKSAGPAPPERKTTCVLPARRWGWGWGGVVGCGRKARALIRPPLPNPQRKRGRALSCSVQAGGSGGSGSAGSGCSAPLPALRARRECSGGHLRSRGLP